MTKPIRGRFAPSPSGRMHLGNLFAALLAWLDVRSLGGEMLLRMEDLDPDRCKPQYTLQLADDLRWLGLDWDLGWQEGLDQYTQSRRTEFYAETFRKLEAEGLLLQPEGAVGRLGPPRLRRLPGVLWPVPDPDPGRKKRPGTGRSSSGLADRCARRDHCICGR